MNIHSIITVYNSEDDPHNPLIQLHYVTTCAETCEANYKALVARELSDLGWTVHKKGPAQTTLVRGRVEGMREYITVRHESGTKPIDLHIGRRTW